jgi:sortase A
VLTACARAEPAGQGEREAAAVPSRSAEAPSAPAPTTSPSQSPSAFPEPEPPPPPAPEPRRSYVSVPALGLRGIAVVRYRGTPDDGPGTRLQDGGVMASPRGPGGGVGPGDVGNFIVTGHRTSHGAPLADLPELGVGARVSVRSGAQVFDYRIVRTRSTSFRSAASLARQSAPVPGRPGVAPTRAMITLSTCATPEDHAAGNYWADEHDNPEHRIDKIGVLERVRRAG